METNRCKVSSDQTGENQNLIPGYRIRREQESLQFRVDWLFHQSLALSQDRKKRSNLTRKLACLPHNLPQVPLLTLPSFFFFPFLPISPVPFHLSHHTSPHNMTQSPIPDDPNNSTENSSPSDFHSSVETSPAIVPLSEPSVSDGGHSPPSAPSRSSFHHRASLDTHKSVSTAGRGGCWCVHLPKTLTSLARLTKFPDDLLPPLGPAVFDEKYVLR